MNYAGLLFPDECPPLQACIFCAHWDSLDKSGGTDDAVDEKEFEGDLIFQLLKSHDFVKMNSKVRWKKMSDPMGKNIHQEYGQLKFQLKALMSSKITNLLFKSVMI